MSRKDFSAPAHQSRTPRGSHNQPVRWNTRRKRANFGLELLAKAAERRNRRSPEKNRLEAERLSTRKWG